MKRPIRSLTLCLALTAALLAGCSQPEPEGKPVPEPYYPEPEVVTPAPVPEQPDPEPVDPADPEPAPEPVPEPSVPEEVPTPVEPGPAVPDPVDPAPIEQTGPTLKDRLNRAYTYTTPDTGDVHYIEFKTVNGSLLAEVAVSPAAGSRYSYWMAELEPVDGESLNNRSGEPCLIRSREFSGFSSDGAYWGPEEIISLIVDNEGILCRKGDRDYLLKSAEEIDEIHDETNMRRYLQLLDGPLMNRETLAASGIPGKREITGSQYGAHVYTWLELEENGLFWLMRKGLDTPTELYRGAYAVSADGTTIHYSAERLGYNTMPYLGKWKASVGKDDILRLTDEKGGQIRLSTIPGASVDFCPVGIEIPEDERSSLTFTYHDRDYHIPDYAPAVNAVVDTVPVGKYIVVEGHVGPKNGVYLIFNTETEEFEQMMSGHNLIWHSDDINTALFAFWGDIYTYDGKLVGSITQNAGEDAMIYDMEFSPDHQSVHVLALTGDGGEMNVTFNIP